MQSGGSSCQGSLLSLTEVEQSSATAESILQGDDLGPEIVPFTLERMGAVASSSCVTSEVPAS